MQYLYKTHGAEYYSIDKSSWFWIIVGLCMCFTLFYIQKSVWSASGRHAYVYQDYLS